MRPPHFALPIRHTDRHRDVSTMDSNASTFTARVDYSERLESRLSARSEREKEPRHGGAPGPALDVVFEIGDATGAPEICAGNSRPVKS
jgi:hypothetical protein